MKSITVRVIGGLGNQLHCYAFGRALATQSGAALKLDTESGYWNDPYGRVLLLDQFSGLNGHYTLVSQPKSRWLRQFFRLRLKLKSFCSRFLPYPMKLVIMEKAPFCYKEKVHHARYVANPYFIGYWASFRYYRGVEKELRSELKPAMPTHPEVLSLLSQIRSVRSCFIHWRSYKEEIGVEHSSLSAYYRNAIGIVSEKYPDIVFFVFSDDPGGARKEVISLDKKIIYVDLSAAQGNLQSLADFYLMYACDHAIIGNSTFSWWAAWLGEQSERTVVAPGWVSPWGADWLPPHWFVLDINDCKESPCLTR